MVASKIQIGLLDGKLNWSTWKFKFCILLRSIPNGNDVLKGKLTLPVPVPSGSTKEEKDKYEKDFPIFTQADSHVLLLLTLNMTQDTLQRVMRISTAREMWLPRLYDGASEEKTYDLCMEFFRYKKEEADDMATHM